VGHQPTVEGDQFQLAPLQSGDTFLLSSDGLHGMVEDTELLRIGVRSGDLPEAASNFITAANNRGGHDNITCLLVRVVSTGAAGAAGETVALQTRPVSGPTSPTQPGLRPPPEGSKTGRRTPQLLGLLGVLVVAVGAVMLFTNRDDSRLASARAPAAAPPPAGPPAFTGRVELPPRLASAPSGSAVVVAVGPGGRRLNAPVETDGRFSLKLPADAPAGEYTLSILPERIAVEGGVALCGSAGGPGRFAAYPPQQVHFTPGGGDLVVNLPCTIDTAAETASVPAAGLTDPAAPPPETDDVPATPAPGDSPPQPSPNAVPPPALAPPGGVLN
jgi:hypothetical protein